MKMTKIDIPEHGVVLYTVSRGSASSRIMINKVALADPVGRSMLAKRLVMMRRKIRVDLAKGI